MAEFRSVLFKANETDRAKKRKDAQRDNRIQKKQNLFDAQRCGISDNFLTSTPYHKKRPPADENASTQDLSGVGNKENAEPETTTQVDVEKRRKEAYLKRFVEWKNAKQNKKKQMEVKKPPFVPCGKPKKSQPNGPGASSSSFGPPNHKFRAPAGIAEPAEEPVTRHSIYVAIDTPPRKKKTQEVGANKQRVASGLLASNTKVSTNAATNKGAVPKRPLKTNMTVLKDFAISGKNTAAISLEGASTSRAAGLTNGKSEVMPKIANKSAPGANKWPVSTENVVPAGETVPTNAATNKGAVPKRPITLATVPKDLAASKKSIPAAVSMAGASTSRAKGDALKKVSETRKPTSAIQRPESIRKTNIAPSTAAGAAAKAKNLEKKRNAPVKQPERAKLAVSLKAKSKLTNLSAQGNHVAKKKITAASQKARTAALVTPLDLCKPTGIFDFITSTQMKSPKVNVDGNGFTACEGVSAIKKEPLSSKTPREVAATKPTSAKRALLLPTVGDDRPRKYNFLREQELEVTAIESPMGSLNASTIIEAKTLIGSTRKTPTPRSNKVHKKKFNFVKNVSLNDTTIMLEKTQIDNKIDQATEETPKRKLQGRKSGNFNEINCINKIQSPAVEKLATENECNTETNGHDTPENPVRPPNYLSPYVTCSRGVVSAKKEREKRDSIYLPSTPNKKVDITAKAETPIETRRAREAVLYFRRQLNDEIQRLHALCDTWQTYKDSESDKLEQSGGSDMIDVTIGQTKLLTSKKFMQFNGLIERCEAHANGNAPADDGSEKTKVITPVDLEGFWSMLGLQVENIEKRFSNLDRWKANGWLDPDAAQEQAQPIKKRTKKMATTKVAPRANSALNQKIREMREAMLRAKQAENAIAPDKVDSPAKYSSPRRTRRSTLTKSAAKILQESLLLNSSHTPDRICVVVPDRRQHSIAPTVISLPSQFGRVSSPLSPANRSSMNGNESKELLKRAVLSKERPRRRSSSMRNANKMSLLSVKEREITPSPTRTPSPVGSIQNGYKPILKTPGTARAQARNVSFNVLCSVKKFRKFGKNLEATEYDQVEQVHIDDMKVKMENESMHESSDEMDARTYRLRNRKVVLRPSSEFEIPK